MSSRIRFRFPANESNWLLQEYIQQIYPEYVETYNDKVKTQAVRETKQFRRTLLGALVVSFTSFSGCVDLAQENPEGDESADESGSDDSTGEGTDGDGEDNGESDDAQSQQEVETAADRTEIDADTREEVEQIGEDILTAFSNGEFDRMESFIYPGSPTEVALDSFDTELLEEMSDDLTIELQEITVKERVEDRITAHAEVRYVQTDEDDRVRSGEAELRYLEGDWLIYSGDFLLPV